jgi:hypothetical protein
LRGFFLCKITGQSKQVCLGIAQLTPLLIELDLFQAHPRRQFFPVTGFLQQGRRFLHGPFLVDQHVPERLVEAGQGQLAAGIAQRFNQAVIFFPDGIAKL